MEPHTNTAVGLQREVSTSVWMCASQPAGPVTDGDYSKKVATMQRLCHEILRIWWFQRLFPPELPSLHSFMDVSPISSDWTHEWRRCKYLTLNISTIWFCSDSHCRNLGVSSLKKHTKNQFTSSYISEIRLFLSTKHLETLIHSIHTYQHFAISAKYTLSINLIAM